MKLALVTPWFGRDLKGGAEQQAWQIATRLAARGHNVEVLTTCCLSFHEDWATNHLPAGSVCEPEGFTVTRFPVEPRDRATFDLVCGKLCSCEPGSLRPGVSPVLPEESHIWLTELIKAPLLLRHLSAQRSSYDQFLLLPYLYGIIVEAISLLGADATLQPCLHDEAYAYLPEIADAFHQCGRLFFNSSGEMELAMRLFGPAILPKSTVIGEGVEDAAPMANQSYQRGLATSVPTRFILYLGRKEIGKNVGLLLRAFARFRAARPNSDLYLLLAGHGSLPDTDISHVLDLGVVTEEQKTTLLRRCLGLVQPSTNESFSRAMMEAWLARKPVLVHGQCLATATAVQEAGGGFCAANELEWAALFAQLDRTPPADLELLGERGEKYARRIADWNSVMQRYEQAFITPAPGPRYEIPQASGPVNQFLPNLTYGDAISEHALFIRDRVRAQGINSTIFVHHADARMSSQCEPVNRAAFSETSAALYHHSIGSDLPAQLSAFSGPKALIYHNITPPEFFDPWRPDFAELLRQGRRELLQLASQFHFSYGVSRYNCDELSAAGFRSPHLLPLVVEPSKWSLRPDAATMARLLDGRTNILFVGRMTPNKKQDDLIVSFARYRLLDQTARLILVGDFNPTDPFFLHLQSLIRELAIAETVEMPGSVTTAQLHAYYRSADLFWSMSEHEGFGAPLIEAMWFDLPVLAFAASAIPETLGDAALTFQDKNNSDEVAALAYVLTHEPETRASLIAAQRGRRIAFTSSAVEPALDKMLSELVGTSFSNTIPSVSTPSPLSSRTRELAGATR
ncbi:MAG: glycosyltransferase [Verrucomicrobiota bacterium]|nr:glycosyltransferase [Verrucomicrobiota bacterium]